MKNVAITVIVFVVIIAAVAGVWIYKKNKKDVKDLQDINVNKTQAEVDEIKLEKTILKGVASSQLSNSLTNAQAINAGAGRG